LIPRPPRDLRSHARRATLACASIVLACGHRIAHADHESPFYPSFYPQEIRIETVDAATAAAGWPKARVHAYVGGDPFGDRAAPDGADSVESLRAYVTLTLDPSPGRQPAARDAHERCSAARSIGRAVNNDVTGFVRHPWPVTPYHGDYLEQYDLVRQALAQDAADGAPLADARTKIRAVGSIAQALVPAAMRADTGGWDATLEVIDADRLAARETGMWGPPPWVRQGWFQAHLLYRGHAGDAAAAAADFAYRKRVAGDYANAAERINLERRVVSALVADCERVVVGYTSRREYFNADYSAGVERIAFDSQSGLRSRIFPRSVKLKDFPWNGWLRVGVPDKPTAAWNPIGGFTDAFGQQLWLSIGDSALLADPYGASWIANRASVVSMSRATPTPIPADAVRPDADTGQLRAVGAARTARQVLRYSVITSAFHDGTSMDVADILYPYVFAYRWSAQKTANAAFDPAVARQTALLREWLAGVKVIGTHTQTRRYGGDLTFSYRIVDVDVYLAHRAGDPWEAAAAAPPWSTLPWEVIALMEESALRGIAALSSEEAHRRNIPWLDLVRDRQTGERLAALVDEFREQGYRPPALANLVTRAAARARWAALRAYYDQHGHFLVTNGPYRLDSWSGDAAVLAVFRDASYPLGVGAFDDYALPRRGYVSKVDDLGDRLEIAAEIEQVAHFQRSYEITRAPLGPVADPMHAHDLPQCRYVVIAPRGDVVRAGSATLARTGRFRIDLRNLSGPGTYRVALAVFVAPNGANPDITVVEHRVGGARSTRQTAAS
jgi:hypothetical protein